ncbi:MAG: GHKL domain-containing protein [Acetatifactor sp.]|nr:GHKL domain-containing protein [Acetatifactor sp.]
MYNLMTLIWEIVLDVAQGYCLQFFYGNFFERRKYMGRFHGLCVVISYTVLKLVVSSILPAEHDMFIDLAGLLWNLGLLTVLAFVFYLAENALTIFLVIIFRAVSEICFCIAYTFLQVELKVYDLLFWGSGNGYIDSDWTSIRSIENIGVVLVFFYTVFFACILYLSLRKIVQSFQEKDHVVHRTELLFLLMPGLAGLLICTLLRMIMITVEDGMQEILYDRYPLMLLLVPAIAVLCLLAIIYGVSLSQDMIRLNRERNSRAILEKQIDDMQEHIAEMERVYSGIRSMKHDMKNTLSVIMQLAVGEDKAQKPELQNYLSELNRSFDRLEFRFQTGNTVVDTLLNMKYHEIARTVPDLQMQADKLLFPGNLLIQGYDICVILGNALDNAMEACEKQKAQDPKAQTFIRLSAFLKGRMFFIEVENSFDGKIIRRKDEEFPQTDKADKKMHGLGLTNIKNTAEKYHGAVDWSVNNKVFTLSVMMKNESGGETA